MPKILSNQSGQILLLTLLVLSVASTIALSLVGRITTDVAISNQVSESTRAFNAAEAGIEETLKLGLTGTKTLTPGLSYTVNRSDIGGVAGDYVFSAKTKVESVETLWLVNHDTSGSLLLTPTYTANYVDVCWSSEAITPAMIVGIYVQVSGGGYQVARGAYDPDVNRASANNFSTVTATTGGCGANTQTTYRQRIRFSDFSIDPSVTTVIAFRLLPVYSDTKIAIDAPQAIPIQGYQVESSGTTDAGVTRKIVVDQPFKTPPAIIDYVIYSQGNFRH